MPNPIFLPTDASLAATLDGLARADHDATVIDLYALDYPGGLSRDEWRAYEPHLDALGVKGISIRAFMAAVLDGKGFVRVVVDRPVPVRHGRPPGPQGSRPDLGPFRHRI